MNIKLFSTTPSCAQISPAVLVNFFIAAFLKKKKKSGVENRILLLIVTAPLNLSLFFWPCVQSYFPNQGLNLPPLQ